MSGIKDVATEAGVSIATVSRALHGLEHVNEKTRTRILAAAAKLNYSMVGAKKIARDGRSKSVGIVAPQIASWYYAHVINGAEEALREKGFDLLLFNFSKLKGRERLFSHQLLNERVDALIVISFPPAETEFETMLGLDIPIALVGMHRNDCISIAIDDVAAAKTVTQHLVNQGHRNIAMMSGLANDPFSINVQQNRKFGFMQVIAENGLEWNPSREVNGDFTMTGGSRAMEELLTRPNRPTALFCQTDLMAFGAMQSLRRHGLKVPDDISIVGFDGHEMAEFSDLTTIEQPVELMGELAAKAVMEQIYHPGKPIFSVTPPTTLIVRNSTREFLKVK